MPAQSTSLGLSGREVTLAQGPARDLERRQIFDKVSARLFGGPGNTSRYEILHKLGAGGMGVVYAAEDPVLACRVALKQLHGHLMAEPDFLDRLRSEARAMARLRSEPHVVDLYDFFVQGDVVFVVMELVDGTTLRAWQSEPRPHAEVLDKYHQAGLGLAAAHRAGLIHRDFKPENVLLTAAGVAKVSDFGLAHVDRSRTRTHDDLSANTTMTRPGLVHGTARYMSPEQLAGRPLDPRSDQFSFCVALWEALLHEHPFYPIAGQAPEAPDVRDAASTIVSRGAPTPVEFAHAIADGPLRPVPATTAVPAHVLRALTRGLRKHPDERFASMDALLAALREAPVRGNKLRLVGATLGLAAVVAWTWPAPPPAPPPTRAQIEGSRGAELTRDLALEPVRRRLHGDGSPSVTHVLAGLERYVGRWASEVAEHEHTLQRHPGDPNTLARLRCLAAAREAAITLTGGLAVAPPSADLHAAELVDELPAPEACSDMPPAWLGCALELDRLREQPAASPVFTALQQSDRLEAAGDFKAAILHAADAVRHAGPLELPTLRGQANYRHGRLLYLAGRSSEAAAALSTARDAVEATGCVDLRADIYSRLIKVTAIYPSLPAEGADEWTRLHATLARDTPDAGHRVADALNERGLLRLLRRHDPRGALEDLERAAELREWQLGGRASMDLADTRLNVAIARRELGEFTAAHAALAEATRLRHAVAGPAHPINYKEHLERGLLRIDQGLLEVALVDLESALALAEAGFGRASGPAARAALGQAQALAGLERATEAIAAANDAAARARTAEIDPSERFELQAIATLLAARYGDTDAEARLATIAEAPGADPRIIEEAQAELTLGLAVLAMNRDDDAGALRHAERTLVLLGRADVPETAPIVTAALRLRGIASYYLDDRSGAIRDLERSLGEVSPELAAEWGVLAAALVERDQQGDRVRGCGVARILAVTPGVARAVVDEKVRRICGIR